MKHPKAHHDRLTKPTGPGTDLPPADKLSVRQRIALGAIMEGATVAAAARKAGVHPRTAHEWMREDDDFKAERRRQSEELVATLRTRLLAVGTDAADVIAKALTSPRQRLPAAKIAISAAVRLVARNPAADEAPPAPMFVLPPGTSVGFSIPPVPSIPDSEPLTIIDATATTRALPAQSAERDKKHG